MATHVISRCRPLLLNHAIANSFKLIPVGVASLIICRKFQPYSRIPWKFLKPRDRNKKNRDDVYFIIDQIPPMHLLDDALDCIRAYSLFEPEPIDFMLKLNMGEKKVRYLSIFHVGIELKTTSRVQYSIVFIILPPLQKLNFFLQMACNRLQ